MTELLDSEVVDDGDRVRLDFSGGDVRFSFKKGSPEARSFMSYMDTFASFASMELNEDDAAKLREEVDGLREMFNQ